MTAEKNPLSKFVTYNYKWTFGALAAGEYNDPSSYRESGGGFPIIRSGGLPDKPVTTYIEDTLGINVEYFIDNVNIEYLTTPTPGTGPTAATQISFTVNEPYSIGLFFQSIVVASQAGGFVSHLSAPYSLMCEFVGYDDNQIASTISKKVLAINLTNVTFKIDQGGCTYEVEAIPYNHTALLDTIQTSTTDLELTGDTVEQVLAGSQGLATVLNQNQQQLIQSAQRLIPDVYNIQFPVDISGSASLPSSVQTLRQVTTPAGVVTVDTSSRANITQNPNANYIGNSPIIRNFLEYGTSPFAEENQVWDETNRIFTRTNLTIDVANRLFTFSSGTRIQKMIEEIVLTSEWAQNLIDNLQPDSNGMIEWFRIDTRTTVLDPSEASLIGRPAMQFDYVVVPYRVHRSLFEPVSLPQDYTPNMTQCVKAYNYTYTGLNDDVISFELEFNNSFFRPFTNTTTGTQDSHISGTIMDLQRQAGLRIVQTGGDASEAEAVYQALNAPAQVAPFTYELGPGGGATINTNKKAVAQMFNNIVLNSDTENVVVTLKIWGDPYFMADNDAGNYRDLPGQLYQTSDGQIDWQRGEVDVLIRLNSGIDYAKNGLMGLDPAGMFSGIYKVVTVRSSFSGGMFTQELELLRRPNQTANNVEVSNALVDAFTNDGNVAAIQQILSQTGAGQSAMTPYLISLPPELQQFTQLGSIAQLQDLFQLPDNAISQALGQAQALISLGSQIQSNLLGTLGSLGLGGLVPLGQLQAGLSQTVANIGQLPLGQLQAGITQGIGQIAPQLQGQIGQLAPQLQRQLAQIQGVAGQLQTVGSNFAGLQQTLGTTVQALQNPLSQAFSNVRVPPIPRIRL